MRGMANTRAPKKASPGDWHPADVVAALRKAGWTIRKLGAHLDISHQALSLALVKSYPASEKRIADILDVSPQTIWPSRYNADGSHKKRGIYHLKRLDVKATRTVAAVNGSEKAAA